MRRTVRFAVLVMVVMVMAPALAQVEVAPVDSCIGIDHFPDDPVGSAPSVANIFVSLPGELADGTLTAQVTGASGDAEVSGPIDGDGVGSLRVPLFDYGTHGLEHLAGVSPGGTFVIVTDSIGDGGTFVVDSSETECDPTTLTLAPPPTTTVPEETTTTVPEETTTSVSETTTTVEETAATVPETPTTLTGTTDGGETTDPGMGFPWIPIGMGVIIFAGGYIVYRGSKSPCDEELAAWLAAQKACDEARSTAEAAQSACEEATQAVDDLTAERNEVCQEWPPACDELDDDSWIENAGDPGSRITSLDLHLKRLANGEVWAKYRAGEMTAKEVERAWEEMETPEFTDDLRQKDADARAKLADLETRLNDARQTAKDACDEVADAKADADAACARAAAAKAAYDACIGAATAAPPPPPPSTGDDGDPPGEDPPSTGGTPPPTAPPEDPPTAYGEEIDPDPMCCPCGEWWVWGWTLGGIFGWGKEFSYVQFVCRCDSDRWLVLESQSHRAGLALGGETSIFVGYLWGAQHASDIPQIWANNSATGFDFDISLGPSATKIAKAALKEVLLGSALETLKRGAKTKIKASNFAFRKLLQSLPAPDLPTAGGMAKGSLKDQVVGQQLAPQLIVIPVGAGVQVGVWHKWCTEVEVFGHESCGCTPSGWGW